LLEIELQNEEMLNRGIDEKIPQLGNDVPKLDLPSDINPPVNIAETSAANSPALQKLQLAIDDLRPLNKQQSEILFC